MTTATPNGPRKLQTFFDKLETYMKENGVPTSLPRDIDKYINMSRDELLSLSTDELGGIQYEINCLLYHIQTVHNKQLAKVNKCEYEINKLIATSLPMYDKIFGIKEKRIAAIQNNDVAVKFLEIEINASAAAKRMENIPQRLENIARTIDNIARRRQH